MKTPPDNIKFIYWFAFYNLDSPSVRYRAKYPLEFAKNHLGINSYFVIPHYSITRIIKFFKAYCSALFFPKDNSIIVIQKVRSNFIYSNLLKLLVHKRRGMTIYDIDDADYFEYKTKTIYWFAKNCNSVSAGSESIMNHMRQFNQNVFLTTSPVLDLDIIKQKRNEKLTIGWVGQFGGDHKKGIYELIFPAIKSLAFDCKFVLLGVVNLEDKNEIINFFKSSKNIELHIPSQINWNDEIYIQKQISEFDIGVATLLNTPIQIAKSGIKAKQYLNNGVPVLCNNIAENNNFVIHDYNGLICNSADEFNSAVIRFKKMSNLEYSIFSKNARDSIVHFNHVNFFKALENKNRANNNA